MIEFKAWPKTPRLNRDIVITEKIDGTNAAIQIVEAGPDEDTGPSVVQYVQSNHDGPLYAVLAQSRKRLITPEDDNAGFAKWVYDNATTLVNDLGPGTHFGEWWGAGIQRRYGQTEKWFSLFNTAKWDGADFSTRNLRVVPVLYQGPFQQIEIDAAVHDLRETGSFAVLGFDNPEGITVFHTAANMVFKVTLEDDESPKSLVT